VCSDYNECVHRELEITNLEKKMMMMTNSLMHREGVSTIVGGLGSSMLAITVSPDLKPSGYLKIKNEKYQRTAHFRSLETGFRIKSEMPSPGA
jgi:hypothetical protein